MLNLKIRNMLRSKLAEIAEQLSLNVAYPNAKFEPQVGEHYLEFHLIPFDTRSDDLANATRTYTGVVQININAPKGTGESKSLEISEEIIKAFQMNTKISDDIHTVYVTSEPTCYNAQYNDTHYTIPIRFKYRLDTY